MISPWGIDHGISKSYQKNAPKLYRALHHDTAALKHGSMDEKLRQHSVSQRLYGGDAGVHGARAIAKKPELKEKILQGYALKKAPERNKAAKGMYEAIGRNNRKRKKLP